MDAIFNLINQYILSPVLRVIMNICGGNFAVTIVVFTVLINVVMIPLSIKSQKSTVQQIKIRPKLDELKKKYGDDRQKMAMAQQQLYQDEKVSMSGGCLPMIIRLVFLMSVFYLITRPLSYLTALDSATIQSAVQGLKDAGLFAAKSYSDEITLIQFVQNAGEMAKVTDSGLIGLLNQISAEINPIDFNLFGINLTNRAEFNWNFAEATREWIIPIASGICALISGVVSSSLQKAMNPDAPNMMAMNLVMPIFSMVIAFNAPGGLGFYWACSSLISGLVQAGVQYFYSPYKMIAAERAKNLLKENEQERKIINK